MIDHILAFPTEPEAFNDPIVGQYHTLGTRGNPPTWDMSRCIPAVLIWNPADDTTDADGGVIHLPIDGQFRVVITLPHPDPDLIDHPNLELAVDHDMGRVIGGSFSDTQLATLAMQPVLAGSKYPFLINITRGLGRRQ